MKSHHHTPFHISSSQAGSRHQGSDPCPLHWKHKVITVSLVAQMVKNPHAMREAWVQSLGWEDSLKKEVATQSSILAWRIPMYRGTWWATVHGVTKSWTWQSPMSGRRKFLNYKLGLKEPDIGPWNKPEACLNSWAENTFSGNNLKGC